MRLILKRFFQPLLAAAELWRHFWCAVRYWNYLNYSWTLAWYKARRP